MLQPSLELGLALTIRTRAQMTDRARRDFMVLLSLMTVFR